MYVCMFVCIRGGMDVDFLIFADADIDEDIYFQYLRMGMLKIMRMRISGQDVDISIFTDTNVDTDKYFQFLRIRMLKIMRISADADADIVSTSSMCVPVCMYVCMNYVFVCMYVCMY